MHKTKQGETWDMISIAEYGTPFAMEKLIAANPQYSDVLIFDAGIELIVPEIEEATVYSLPPWKRSAST